MKVSDLIFSCHAFKSDPSILEICIGTVKTWEEDHCLDDCYFDGVGELVDMVTDKFCLCNSMESTYEYLRGDLTVEQMRDSLIAFGLTWDPSFNEFIGDPNE